MPEFLTLLPPQDALAVLLANLPPASPGVEFIPVENTLGRINASDVLAPESLPAFDRSTVDGFAVHASDTFGASESLPAYLILAEEISMGKPAELPLKLRYAAPIHTGGMLPPGADAVVMLEYSQSTGGPEIEILRPAAPLENILKAGEDIQSGQILLPRGKLIRPPEIGGLSALGIQSISCFRKPQVGILSSGDEVIPPGQVPLPGQVRDINSFTLSALAEKHGASVTRYGILPDKEEIIDQRLKEVLQQSDLIIITAGSSASTRDLSARVVHRMGSPGVLVHGINLKPGKPTILAVCDGKPIIGLPGNPVSALVVAGLFVVPVINHLSGLANPPQQSRVPALLTINITSQAGREDWVPVKLIPSAEGWLAEPIFYKSNLIFSLVAADGLIRIPPASNGLPARDLVEVYIL